MCAQANETSIVHWYTSSHPFLFSLFPFFPSTCPSLILLSSFSHPSLILLSSFSLPSLILLSSFSLPSLFLLSSPSLPPSLPPLPSLPLPSSRSDLDSWVHHVERLVRNCREACHWFINLLGSQQGCGYLK